MTQGRIPVTIVTGFLGSGKTTLLAGLVRRRQTRRLALLINEFGEVSIDGTVLRDSIAQSGAPPDLNGEHADHARHIRIVELSQGLIAYGDDTQFMPAMQAIAAHRATIDHVLIETSGLALPSAVMALLQSPLLAGDFVLDATLAVVDTPLLLAGEFGQPTSSIHPDQPIESTEPDVETAAAASATLFAQQLALADVVVLNKIDALDENQLLQAETLVRSCAPNVRFLELAHKAELDLRVALGLRLHQATGAATDLHAASPAYMPYADAAPLSSQVFFNGHTHSGIGAHNHGLATHRHFHEQDPGWLSFTLRCDAEQALPQLQHALAEAARQEPVLRSKGYVRASGRRSAVLVQGVRSRITLAPPPIATSASTPLSTVQEGGGLALHTSELVFIGYHLSRARVARLLSTLTATDWS